MCVRVAEGLLFCWDISSGKTCAARLARLHDSHILGDLDLSRNATCMCIEDDMQMPRTQREHLRITRETATVRVWHCDTRGGLHCWDPLPMRNPRDKGASRKSQSTRHMTWNMGKDAQGISVESCPVIPGVLVLTQTHVVLATAEGGISYRVLLPGVIQSPPPEIRLKVQAPDDAPKKMKDWAKSSGNTMKFPSLDERDWVWVVRPFLKVMVVLTQNRVMISDSNGRWQILENMASFIDAAMDERSQQLFLSHVSGDIFTIDLSNGSHSMLQEPRIYTPVQMVIGRKADANSHMLAARNGRLVVGRPEGIIDIVPYFREYVRPPRTESKA